MNYNVRVGPTYVYVQKYINVHVCFFSDNVMIEHRNVFKNAVKKCCLVKVPIMVSWFLVL